MNNTKLISGLALACLFLVAGCSAQRTEEDCKFSCKDCKEVTFDCAYQESSVDIIADGALPVPIVGK